ncbi:hypothetical protein HYW75_03690 [Candidatus Pacearchaeota archaeon]|nr:hypothetical protein [Candidatus Pacearchaeota archaeon]
MSSSKNLEFLIVKDRFDTHPDFQNRIALIRKAFSGHSVLYQNKLLQNITGNKPHGILIDEWNPIDGGFYQGLPEESTLFGIGYDEPREKYKPSSIIENTRLLKPFKKILLLDGNCLHTVHRHNYQAFQALVNLKESKYFNFNILTFFDFATAQKFIPSLTPFEAYIIVSSHPQTYETRESIVDFPHIAFKAISFIKEKHPSSHITLNDGRGLCYRMPELKDVLYLDMANNLKIAQYIWPHSFATTPSIITDRMAHIDAAYAIRSVYPQIEEKLTEVEKEVIRWRYGVDIGEYKSFEEISKQIRGNVALAKRAEFCALEKIRPFLKKEGHMNR